MTQSVDGRKGLAIAGLAAVVTVTVVACGGGAGDGASAGSGAGKAQVNKADPGTKAAAVATAAGRPSMPAPALGRGGLIESRMSPGAGSAQIDPMRQRDAARHVLPPAGAVVLPALADAAGATSGAATLQKTRETQGIRTKIGEGRAVQATASVAATAAQLHWVPSTRKGKVAALRFASTGARGVRVGLKVDSLPLGGVVRFYADGSDQLFEIPAQEIMATIQRNVDAGGRGDEARTYWSPNLGGEAITVEFEVPPGAPTDAVQVAVPKLSHVFADVREFGQIAKLAAGSCNLDVSCSSDYNTLSRSVAHMDYIQGDGNYLCTGTLLNDQASSGTPYFLSANHCISTQEAASSLVTMWFYTSATCNSPQVHPRSQVLTGGATLLYASAATDTAFMRLNAAPPEGALFAGSSSDAATAPLAVYALHHPNGDFQKYSTGDVVGQGHCTFDADQTLLCGPAASTASNWLAVRWWAGTTEAGSSGGGLFKRVDGKDYLIGQLSGGEASCTTPQGNDYFGRFDLAYRAALHQWLGGPAAEAPPPSQEVRVPVYRLFNHTAGTHFYTADTAERDLLIALFWRDYIYEGVAFYAEGSAGMASDGVHRFFNAAAGTHFYTRSADERAQLGRQSPWFIAEGAKWGAAPAEARGAMPVYRFFNALTSAHFYTINPAERDQVMARYPHYSYEGIGYYGWTAQQ